MFGFEFGLFVGLFGVAALLSGVVVAVDRRIGSLGRSVQLVVVGTTLSGFALLVAFGYVENVAEWALTLLFFYLFFLTGTGAAD